MGWTPRAALRVCSPPAHPIPSPTLVQESVVFLFLMVDAVGYGPLMLIAAVGVCSCGAPRLLPPGVFLSFGAPGRSGASARPAVFVFFPSVGVLALVFRCCGASAFSSSWWLRFACVLWPLCGFRSWLVLLSVCLSFSGCGWCLFLLDALGLLGVSVPFGGRGWCLSFRPPGLPLTLWCSSFFWLLWLVLCVWRSGASARPGVSPFVFWCPGASAQPAPMMCLSSLWLLRPEFVLWPSASSAHGCCCV